jgi:hypothetical protein
MESLNWSSRSPVAIIVVALFVGLVGMLSLSRPQPAPVLP